MKRFFNILAVAAILVSGAVSCVKVQQEDAFSKAPVAPELYAHNDILITENTLAENVTFSWSAYRFLPEGLQYTLYAIFDADPVALATTSECSVTWSKAEFSTLLMDRIVGLPKNDIFSLIFYVSVPNGSKELKSSNIRVSIYARGDAVAAEVTEVMEDTVLDPSDPLAPIEVLSWEPARLVYGEEVTYNVFLALAEPSTKAEVGDEEEEEPQPLNAEPLTTTSLVITADALNEAIVAAGGVEEDANSVVFTVVAYCESLPNGIPSHVSDPVEVSTYLATFPDEISVVGDLSQNDLVLKHSSKVKGTFEGAIVIAKAESETAKFTLESTLGKFGGDVKVDTYGENPVNYIVDGTVSEEADAIEVPGGMYYVNLNMKLKTLQMIQINSLSVIGAAVGGWDAEHEVDLEYDSAKNRFEAVATLTAGEYKIRFNHDWTYAFAEDPSWLQLGADAQNLSNSYEGEYRVIMNVGKAPFSISMINANLPEKIYMVGGDFGSWDWNSDGVVELIPVLHNPDWGAEAEGQFWTIRYLTAGNGVKFNSARAWDGNEFGKLATNDGFENDKDGNLVVAESGIYMIHMDFVNGILHVEPARVYGIGNCFGGWDEGMEDALFVAEGKKLKITVPAAGEIRMYAASEIATSPWWTREFVFFDGEIAYRGAGDDQERVRVFKDKVVTLDFNAGTATVTGEGEGPQAPDFVSLIGTINETNWDTDFDMETLDGETWTIKGVTLTANDMFKIRENHDWIVSYGGPEATGKVGDDDVYTPELGKEFAAGSTNINVGKAGEYAITFKWDAEEPTILIEEYQSYPDELFMTGTDFGNWDWNSDGVVVFTPVLHNPEWGAEAEGQFWAVRYLTAGHGFKLNGARAWDGNQFGKLTTNNGFTNDGDGNIQVAEDGFYMIHVDFVNSILNVEPAKIYGIGDAFGSWDEGVEDNLFAVDGNKMKITTTAAANLRMYAASSIATSPWWTREFNIYDGVITYRGAGGDLADVPVLKNQVVSLDFNAGTGAIEGEGEEPSSDFADYIYAIGDDTSWSSCYPLRSGVTAGANNGVYKGFGYLSAAFKFKPNEADWTGDWEYVGEGKIGQGSDNCPAPETAGYYMIEVDLNKMTYALTLINGIGIIGPAQEGGWNADTDLTYNAQTGAWEGTVTFTAGAMKFRANDDWAINWGASLEALVQGGADITVEAGTYDVALYAWCDGKAYATLTEAAAPATGITIDGDLSDWADVTPAYAGINDRIVEWKASSDETNVYFYYKMTASKIKDNGSSKFYVGFNLDNDVTTGSQGEHGGAGNDAGLEALAFFYPWVGTTAVISGEDPDSWVQKPVGTAVEGKVTVGGKIEDGFAYLEVSIPRASIGSPASGAEITVKTAVQYYPTTAEKFALK